MSPRLSDRIANSWPLDKDLVPSGPGRMALEDLAWIADAGSEAK